MDSRVRRALRVTGTVVGILVAFLVLATGTAWWLFDASLPRLDGTIQVDGLETTLRIERDAKGRTTVVAASRVDLAYGVGFAHGQDRYFQMDLLRRAGAGELAALIGRMGLDIDRTTRSHDLRTVARAAFAQVDSEHRARLEAYARGVNAGRESLGARPWEYLLLRQAPRPWRAVDTMHVIHAMTRDLQNPTDFLEMSRVFLPLSLDAAVAEALSNPFSPWDAPIVDDPTPPFEFDVPDAGPALSPGAGDSIAAPAVDHDAPKKGSNSFAVGGAYTVDGRAMFANDMHLSLRLPNIWYAVRMLVEGENPLDSVGVTLPGAPALIAGSNGSIAWGFTNAYGDWVDHVGLETDPDDPMRYRTPDGWATLEERLEVIEIAGGDVDTLRVLDTIWGPRSSFFDDVATRWVAHEPDATNIRLLDMLDVRSLEQALDLATECGVPHQNFVVADADGRIGWTMAGRVPRRFGFDGSVPVRWTDGTVGWDGWLGADEVPRHVFGPEGRIWTANNRVTTREGQRVLGLGNFALGARATVIRDALQELDTVNEEDLLAVAETTRSPLMQRWYERLRVVVETSDDPAHRKIVRWIDDWTGGADVRSVSYRLVRAWRAKVSLSVLDEGLLEPTREAAGGNWIRVSHREPAVWSLLTSRPTWVPAPHASWHALERAALDAVIESWGDPDTWADRTWGARNTTRIEHPFASVFPDVLADRLRLPPRQVAGDSYTARVASPSFGASERLIVRPGAEEDGILHLPGGNASHPRSPFFQGTYEAWVTGRPTPLLPGPAAHTLILEPR